MNIEEHALLVLMEECAEVAHAASKIIRFGWDVLNPYELKGPTNREKLIEELSDLIGCVRYLELHFDQDRVNRKQNQIEKYWRKYQDERD